MAYTQALAGVVFLNADHTKKYFFLKFKKMKIYILVFLFIAAGIKSNAQSFSKFSFKEHKTSAILTFLGGAFDGVRDASMFGHIKGGRWVNSDLEAWRNKYKNGNPAEGAAFFGSKGMFVTFTDLPHTANFFSNSLDAASKVFMPNMNYKNKWQKVGVIVFYRLVQMAGHNLMYDVVFKDRRNSIGKY